MDRVNRWQHFRPLNSHFSARPADLAKQHAEEQSASAKLSEGRDTNRRVLSSVARRDPNMDCS